jgi:hypothetical protein
MRKGILTLLVLVSSLFFGGCSLSNKKSAVEINSYPVAKVFIDGKEMGLTPYRNRSLSPGEIEVKLETKDQTWVKKIKLQNNISTVVDWEFGESEENSGGYILYLEKTGDKKNAGLMVNTNPNKCTVTLDNEVKGLSPLRIADIGEGDRHLALSFPGHKTLDVFMKSLKEYQLVVDAVLAEDKVEVTQDEVKEENPDLVTAPAAVKIKIKETETGWLRVRESSSSAAREIAKVNPGATYAMLEESRDWFKIDLGDGQSGWISTTYGEKSE